jgi:glyoxylase-like metal-dependent hydrolase (beta-lactamase superfamily II)
VRPIDVKLLGLEHVVCCWQVGDVLVDPGPESRLPTLLEALGDERPRAIALTHIHFDHAGAAGALVERWPDLEVWVHERGAKHMIDPERLVTSAKRLYGDEFDELWGRVVPIPEGNLRVLGSEPTEVGEFDVAYMPGHASHHVAYRHRESGWVFCGDVAGVRLPPGNLVLAPTPPPDIDLDAWRASLDVLEAWEPTTLALTHFGAYDDVADHLRRLRADLDAWGELARSVDQTGYANALRAAVAGAVGDPLIVEAYAKAMPAGDQWLGLDRYWSKRAEADG